MLVQHYRFPRRTTGETQWLTNLTTLSWVGGEQLTHGTTSRLFHHCKPVISLDHLGIDFDDFPTHLHLNGSKVPDSVVVDSCGQISLLCLTLAIMGYWGPAGMITWLSTKSLLLFVPCRVFQATFRGKCLNARIVPSLSTDSIQSVSATQMNHLKKRVDIL